MRHTSEAYLIEEVVNDVRREDADTGLVRIGSCVGVDLDVEREYGRVLGLALLEHDARAHDVAPGGGFNDVTVSASVVTEKQALLEHDARTYDVTPGGKTGNVTISASVVMKRDG